MKKNILIIAEAGINHNGNLELAKKLIDVAKDAGADIVKFQTFRTENLVTKDADMADYQKENTQKNESQFQMLKKLELKETDFVELKQYAEKIGIVFLSTGFDLESINFLKTLNLDIWKIPSGEITNLPYLELIGSFNQKVILSTGMSTIEEIIDAINILIQSGTPKNKITVLHCSTEYPAPYESVHLNAMLTIKNELGVAIGYSDHTPGIEVSLAAASLGATVIEKHFTLDKTLEGPDHAASLDPDELKNLVSCTRHIELALGEGAKKPSEIEQKNKEIARKSIVAKCAIKKNELFTIENLTCKRPGTGISPMKLRSIIGSKAPRDFAPDELIKLETFPSK